MEYEFERLMNSKNVQCLMDHNLILHPIIINISFHQDKVLRSSQHRLLLEFSTSNNTLLNCFKKSKIKKKLYKRFDFYLVNHKCIRSFSCIAVCIIRNPETFQTLLYSNILCIYVHLGSLERTYYPSF